MNILKFIYPKSSIRRKIYDIQDAIKDVVKSFSNQYVYCTWFGEYTINPKHLFFCVLVQTDLERNRLKNNEVFIQQLRNLFYKYDYPAAARDSILIDIESQQTVDRESHGDLFFHYKSK